MSTTESRFFRRPRKSNLELVNISKVKDPADLHDEKNSSEDLESGKYSSESDTSSTDGDDVNANGSNPAAIYSLSQENFKFPPLNIIQKLHRDQLICIAEENTTINDSSTSKENFYYSNQSNPNSPAISPKFKHTTFNTNNQQRRFTINPNNNNRLVQPTNVYLKKNSPLPRPFKPLGPDPLPIRPVKLHVDNMRTRNAYYQSLSYDNSDLNEADRDYFELNDFLLENNYNQRLVASCVRNISTYNYKQICRILEAEIQEDRNKNPNQV